MRSSPLPVASASGLKKVAILDRDGTMVEERGYIVTGGEVVVFPETAKAIKELNDHGWLVVGASNQSGIARGYTTAEYIEEVNQRLMRQLAEAGARVEKIYVCPHHPLQECECRKPKAGLLHQVAKDFQVALQNCVMVGDKTCDIEMGKSAGLKTVLVLTGYGEETREQCTGAAAPDYIANNLLDAAEWIIGQAHHGHRLSSRHQR